MSNLLEKLRNENLLWTVPGAFRKEAADEIERLRAVAAPPWSLMKDALELRD